MNNNKQCPVCRSPLTSLHCKKCGFQQKQLKIVEAQQDFGKFNYMSKIQGTHHSNKIKKRLSTEEKLKLYLKQYVKLLKTATNQLATAHTLSLELTKQLNGQVFEIWKSYLLKRKEMNLSLAGMFRRFIFCKQKEIPKKKKPAVVEEQLQSDKSQKQLDSSQQQRKPVKKRKAAARGNALLAQNVQQQTQLGVQHNFRSYYIVTVKPLIQESIEQRKVDKSLITTCQKSFLSYLLAIQEPNEEFVKMCSQKYLKLLLQLKVKYNNQSFVKEGQIEIELKLRNNSCLKKKEESVMLILIIDLLLCVNSLSVQVKQTQQISELLEVYQQNDKRCQIIDQIIECFNKNQPTENLNIPQINYELIYTIINLAVVQLGLCLTIPEIFIGCCKLEINAIAVDDETFIDGVPNQQVINSTKIRKNSHLLATFISLTGKIHINKWSNKWCSKLGLKKQSDRVTVINHLLYKELFSSEKTGEGRGEFFSKGKIIKYQRYIWLEQDIATLAGILIFLKLSAGITQYPYLINFPQEEVTKNAEIVNAQFKVLSKLVQKREIFLENKDSSLVKRMFLPQYYCQNVSLYNISKNLTNLSRKDKFFHVQSLNKSSIRFRNLNHLNAVNSNDLLEKITYIKENHFEPQLRKEYDTHLKFDEHSYKQFIREIAGKYKKLRIKKGIVNLVKHQRQLSINLLKQIACIAKKNEELVEAGIPTLTEQCVVDEPSANYEIMYEYNQQNLRLAKREEQLYFMELLCLNVCSFSQLANWLGRYESVLKQFEMQ